MADEKDAGLPPPVTAQGPGPPGSLTGRARFAPPPPASGTQKIRVHWARLRKRIGTNSNDAPSDSFVDDTLDGSSGWRRASDHHPSSLHSGGGIGASWNNVGGQDVEPEEVDEIVVDNTFVEYGYGVDESGESHTGRTASEKPLELGGGGTSSHNMHTTDRESTNTLSVWDRYVLLSIIRWRILPGLKRFHSLAFADPNAENQYSREAWYSSKALALFAGFWCIFNWVLTCALLQQPSTLDKAFYYGWLPVFNIPVPLLIIFDWPRKRPISYQIFITITVWSWSIYNLFFLYFCGYYPGMHSYMTCGTKDFSSILYFASALPAIGVFALQWRRVPAMLGAVVFIVLAGALIVPHRHSWSRNIVNILIFHVILLYIHYMRENAERRLYTLRDQVKLQYKATQKAQVSERKASDSKRRLTSYIFHEVRVPLNTAMLALQNLEATMGAKRDMDQAIELGALNASLSMMSKDKSAFVYILDFNRMDAGRFESVSKPFAFHKVIRSCIVGVKLAADAKRLELVTELDPQIDLIARAAAFREQGKSEEWIKWQLGCEPNEDAEVLGDEMRLIQVVTNLMSNAAKFTPPGPGGKVTVRTSLIYPQPEEDSESVPPSTPDDLLPATPSLSACRPGGTQQHSLTDSTDATAVDEKEKDSGLSVSRLKGHDQAMMRSHPVHGAGKHVKAAKNPSTIVVRIEVHDTGVGIKPRDMIDNRLFSPYVQTEIGRHQGGKGTGLGLALVRHIVKLSGGRLGVQSRREGGSCFWVEFPFGIPKTSAGTPGPAHHGFPSTPLPSRDPFSRLSDGHLTDGGTPRSEMTHSSNPSNFLDLRGPTIPSEMKDRIIDELPDSAMPPAVVLTTATPDTVGTPSLVNGSASTTPKPSAAQRTPIPLFPTGVNPADISIPPAIHAHPHPKIPLAPIEASPSSTPPTTQAPPSPSPTETLVSSPSAPPPAPPALVSILKSSPAVPAPSASASSPSNTRRDPSPARPPLGAPIPTAPARPNLIRLPTQPNFQHSASDPPGSAAAAAKRQHSDGGSPSTSSVGVETSSVRALVVDDDPLTRRLMERMLNRIGCIVSTAENGQQALDMIKENVEEDPNTFNYDVIFLDNQMPIMSGVAMVKKLREIGRKEFTVGITGNALKEDQVEYMEAGLDRVLTKPVMERSLREALRYALDRRKTLSGSPAEEISPS